jgi:hypothetical protein
MSGIEKVCEFSGVTPDHPELGGWIMKQWKRNHIQINLKYRPLFSGCDHFFRIVGFEVQEWDSGGYSTPCAWQAGNYNSARHYIDEQKKRGRRMRIQYEYVLEVFDPELQGMVEGKYREWSFDLKAVIRNMRRMVGPGLIIVNELEGSRGKLMKKWRAEFQKKRDEILERELQEEREAEAALEARIEEVPNAS